MWKKSATVKTNGYGVATIRRDTYNTVNGFSKKNGWWEIRAAVWKRDKGLCVPCMRLKKVIKAEEVHHIVPLSRGGKTVMSNLMCVCKECHNARHSHLRNR